MVRERPLLLPFGALCVGLSLAACQGILLPITAVAAAFCCMLLSLFISSGHPFRICTAIFFFAWGLYSLTPWLNPQTRPDSILNYVSGSPVIMEGIVASRPVVKNSFSGAASSFVFRPEAVVKDGRYTGVTGRLLIYVESGDLGICRGDRVRLSTRIRIPHKMGLPGEFDYPAYLAYQNIRATGYVQSADHMVLMRAGAEDSLRRRMDLKAAMLGEFIRNSIGDVEVSSILTALLIGDQKRIPVHLSDDYSRAGVVHILSISGFHMGIIAFFIVQAVLLVATRFEYLAIRYNLRRIVLLAALPVMLAYLLLTGAAPATVRSVVMMCIFVAVLYLEREPDALNSLLLAALLMIIMDPPGLFDVSFQLSFFALWGIGLVMPWGMKKADTYAAGWIRAPFLLLVSSCAAIAATGVPVLFYFNQLSLNGIVANFFIIPLLGYGAVLAGFSALLCVFLFPPFAHLLLWVAAKIVLLSNLLVHCFARLPQLSYHGITGSDFAAFILLLSVLTLIGVDRRKWPIYGVIPLVCVVMHLYSSSAADGRLHVTMLSVGQAESILLRMPDGSSMLIDGGGYLYENGLDFGERILAPALMKMGVRRIDRMLVTHCHPDHIGGLPYIAGQFPVGELLEGRSGSGQSHDRLALALAAQGTRLRRVAAGDVLELSQGVVMQVFSPLASRMDKPAHIPMNEDLNQDSVVFRLVHDNQSILFASDAGFQTETRLLERKYQLKSNILKVGHHGSRYSTSERFLKLVSPQIALISAGRGNRFGLPSPDTLALLHKYGVKTYRTDLDGTVELVSDGISWRIETPCKPY